MPLPHESRKALAAFFLISGTVLTGISAYPILQITRCQLFGTDTNAVITEIHNYAATSTYGGKNIQKQSNQGSISVRVCLSPLKSDNKIKRSISEQIRYNAELAKQPCQHSLTRNGVAEELTADLYPGKIIAIHFAKSWGPYFIFESENKQSLFSRLIQPGVVIGVGLLLIGALFLRKKIAS